MIDWSCVHDRQLGGFFIVNLFLAVIFLEYSSAKEKLKDTKEEMPKGTTALGGGGKEGGARHSAYEVGARPATPPRALDREGGRAEDGEDGGTCETGCPLLHCPAPRPSCRHGFARLASSSGLNTLATILVLLNMTIMCMPYEGMSDEYAAQLELIADVRSSSLVVA